MENNKVSVIPKIRRIARITSLVVLSGMLVTLGFNCGRFESGSAPSIQSISQSSQQPAEPPVGFLTAEQMKKAMISAAGVEGLGDLTDPADDLIQDTYDDRQGSLPSVQSLSQATGPTLIAVTNLASAVCAKAVDQDAGRAPQDRLFFREMDFTKGLSGQSSEAVEYGFERLARNAWRRDITPDEREEMIVFAQGYSQASTKPAEAQQTRLLAVSICTATLSSIDALTY